VALSWENYRDDAIHITQSVWHSHSSEPKTRKSKGAIPVIAPLAKRLEFYRARMGNPTSGPIFPNAAGKPMDLNNLLNRVILPTLNRCVHCGKRRTSHILSEHGFGASTTCIGGRCVLPGLVLDYAACVRVGMSFVS